MTNELTIERPQSRIAVWQRAVVVLLLALAGTILTLAFFYSQSSAATPTDTGAELPPQRIHAVRNTLRQEVPLEGNAAPIANPGSPQTVVDADNNGTEPVQLTGGGSRDPDAADGGDGEIVSYAWSSSTGIAIPGNPNPVVEFPIGTHVITLTVTDNSDETDTKSVSVTVMDPITTPIYYRVNAGGGVSEPNDSSAVTWSADTSTVKSIYLSGTNLKTFVTTTTVEMNDESILTTAVTEPMMRTERYMETDGEAGQVMSWDFPLQANTQVEVRIYLAEIWFNAPDERLFSIAIEGQTPSQFNAIKMFEQFGFHHAVMLKETVNVTDGNLDIDFTSSIENPAVKAIEIVEPGTVTIFSNIIYLPVVARE